MMACVAIPAVSTHGHRSSVPGRFPIARCNEPAKRLLLAHFCSVRMGVGFSGLMVAVGLLAIKPEAVMPFSVALRPSGHVTAHCAAFGGGCVGDGPKDADAQVIARWTGTQRGTRGARARRARELSPCSCTAHWRTGRQMR